MAAIRRFIPAASLVQTEDIGRTFATAAAVASRPITTISAAG